MKFNGIIKYFDSARFIQLEHILIWLQSLFQENYDSKHIYPFRNFESFPKLIYIYIYPRSWQRRERLLYI